MNHPDYPATADDTQDRADKFLLRQENDHADHLRQSVDDQSDDAEALASAGFGTDEDYGCYCGGEE